MNSAQNRRGVTRRDDVVETAPAWRRAWAAIATPFVASADDRALTQLRLTLTYAVVLGVFVAGYRLLPYYVLSPHLHVLWNLAPVGALALFVGSRLRGWYAFVLPLAAMLVSDLLLIVPLARMGWPAFSWVGTPVIYASYAVYVLLGRMVRANELSPLVIGAVALLGGVQFFVLTNFVVWLRGSMFPHTLEGLLGCYAFALPFYRNTLAGDMLFTAVFFGLHAGLAWLRDRQKVGQPA